MSTQLPSSENDNKYARLHMADVLRGRVFGAIYAAAEFRKNEEGLSRKELAEKMGRDEAVVSRTFSAPNNWTLKTVSDLCFALNLRLEFVFIDRSNQERVFLDTGMVCRRRDPRQKLDAEPVTHLNNHVSAAIESKHKSISGRQLKWDFEVRAAKECIFNYSTSAKGGRRENS